MSREPAPNGTKKNQPHKHKARCIYRPAAAEGFLRPWERPPRRAAQRVVKM